MTKHDVTTDLTILSMQASVVGRNFPILLEGYLAAVKAGLIKDQVPALQLEYLQSLKTEMLETVEKVKAYVQNVQTR